MVDAGTEACGLADVLSAGGNADETKSIAWSGSVNLTGNIKVSELWN